MSIWDRLGEIRRARPSSRLRASPTSSRPCAPFSPATRELRRKVAFSVAMIALSAKMAKADGIVTQDEVRAFQEIFAVPAERDAQRRAALRSGQAATSPASRPTPSGWRSCAARAARTARCWRTYSTGCSTSPRPTACCTSAKAQFLHRIAEIFRIDEAHYQSILARHVNLGAADPYVVLGIERGMPFDEVRRRYRRLVADNHPDRLIARGVPRGIHRDRDDAARRDQRRL